MRTGVYIHENILLFQTLEGNSKERIENEENMLSYFIDISNNTSEFGFVPGCNYHGLSTHGESSIYRKSSI